MSRNHGVPVVHGADVELTPGPAGLLTSVIGTPYLVHLLWRSR
jgi:hypothetical protein